MQECQKKLDHKLRLDSYLLKPVQRLTKYQLLLKVWLFVFYRIKDEVELSITAFILFSFCAIYVLSFVKEQPLLHYYKSL